MTSSTDTRTKLVWGLLALGWGLAVAPRHSAGAIFLSLILAYSLQPAVDALVQRGAARGGFGFELDRIGSSGGRRGVPPGSPSCPSWGRNYGTSFPDLAVSVWHAVAPWFAKWGLALPTSAEAIRGRAHSPHAKANSRNGAVLYCNRF